MAPPAIAIAESSRLPFTRVLEIVSLTATMGHSRRETLGPLLEGSGHRDGRARR